MVRRILLLSALFLLAVPAISLADGPNYGSGTVSHITVQTKSVNPVVLSNHSTTVMKTEKYVLKTGSLSFTVNNSGSEDANTFNGEIYFPDSATARDGSSVSKLFINMSGFLLNAKKTRAAPMGQGAIRGFVTYSPADGGQTGTLSFSGAYAMKVALAGKDSNGDYAHGTVISVMTLTGILDSSGALQDKIVTITMPATAFTLSQTAPSPPSGLTSTWTMNFDMTSGPDSPQSFQSTLNPVLFDSYIFRGTLTEPGDNLSHISGALVNSNFSLGFTDVFGNTMSLTGTLTSGTYGITGATMSGTFSSTDGDSGTWTAREI
jgi:hypothetical protein